MAPRFTNSEKTDMVLTFGLCQGNARDALKFYIKKYPNRTKPSSSTIHALVMNLRNYGAFQKPDRKPRSDRIAGNEDVEKQAFAILHKNSCTSSRQAAKELGCSQGTILRIWHKRKLDFTIDRFIKDDQLINFYTGFKDFSVLHALFKALEPTARKMINWGNTKTLDSKSDNEKEVSAKNEKISLIDQFFLFLLRVRRGWASKDLALHFKISISLVNSVIVTWTNYLFFVLGALPLWISKEVNQKQMPEVFKKTDFRDTRAIIYIHEIKVKKTNLKKSESDTCSFYSMDKEHFLFKSLYAMSPCAALVFTSNLFPGNMSDRELTIRSGILELLEPHDEVMVENEFPIADVLARKRIKLYHFPFKENLLARPYHHEKELTEISSLINHIRSINQRIKEYKVFDVELSSNLTGILNQLWTVCCILTNFQESL